MKIKVREKKRKEKHTGSVRRRRGEPGGGVSYRVGGSSRVYSGEDIE